MGDKSINKKEQVLEILQGETLSTGRITALISSNQYMTEKILFELEKENKIIKLNKPRGTYWKKNE